MSKAAIEARGLGKKYMIGHQAAPESTLRGALSSGASRLGRRLLRPLGGGPALREEEFWALKEVSFEVDPGERVGIIGRNGAGKSTLLKILSRITEPTEGRAVVRGRVSSLLEVGTGFHPELTGRENIYLNGAILGMARSEIRRKFDEIVAFAEVERFLDTPVKRYSSGMYVRLAFAVAAHLEPEILIVDEVLAVGDAAFQKKCLGKMEEVGRQGRTVLFVSHNMSMVEYLCSRGIILEAGGTIFDGRSKEAINIYLEKSYKISNELSIGQRKDRGGSGRVKAYSFRVIDGAGKEVSCMQSGKDYRFEIGYSNYTGMRLDGVVASIDIFDEQSQRVMLLRSNFTGDNFSVGPETGRIICGVDNLPLANGAYRFSIFLSHSDKEVLDHITDAATVAVDGGDFFGTGSPGLPSHCKILFKARWSTEMGFSA